MTQKITENEETELKAIPETIILCINCSVATTSNNNTLCHECFSSTKPIINSFRSIRPTKPLPESNNSSHVESVKRVVNRCSGCRRKVGLTGFRCRCGDLFCPEHRYSDRHDCSYDYKGVGREMIARENPVVKAAKILRI